MKRVGVVLVVAACGSSSSKTPDAHGIDAAHVDAPADTASIDAAIDAMPDAMIDAPAMGSGSHYHYVINSITWPETSNDARALAFDLDGNGTLDNQLGMVTATMRSQGFDLQTPQDQEIARGAVLMLADLQATDLTTATGAGFTTYGGENPNPAPCNGSADTVCGHHLTGTGTFDVAAMPRETPIVGAITSGQYTGGPGKLPMQLSIVASTPVSTTLLAAHAKLTATGSGIMQGVIGGAIPATDFDLKVYPAMAVSFQQTVQRDCSQLANPPQCGCTASSTGATLISLFDTTPSNCTISSDEVKNNSLIQALFAPDVTINGQMALSAGFGFTAVDATFTP
jgi:hypothetical protein